MIKTVNDKERIRSEQYDEGFGQEARSMESKKDGKGCVMEWQTDEKKVKEKRIGEEGE